MAPLAAITLSRFGVASKVDAIMPLEYSLVTTSTPSTSKASQPRPQPDWMTARGSTKIWLSVPCRGLEAAAQVITADRPITKSAVTARVTLVDNKVRILVHSERAVSLRPGTTSTPALISVPRYPPISVLGCPPDLHRRLPSHPAHGTRTRLW